MAISLFFGPVSNKLLFALCGLVVVPGGEILLLLD